VRLILADDSALLRTSLAKALGDEFEVVGEAEDAEQLLSLVEDRQPDVAIVDIRMPPTYTDEGLQAARRIQAHHPATGVLVLSQYLQTAYAISLISAGPERMGYLLKDRISDLSKLEDALRRLAAGETVIDPDIVARLVSRRRERSPLEDLTARERDVLRLMAEGRSNEGISKALVLSERTVETHVSSIFAKLGLQATISDHRRVLAVLTYLRE
jgi:DNA-binding NarL/FixJ family response regulator